MTKTKPMKSEKPVLFVKRITRTGPPLADLRMLDRYYQSRRIRRVAKAARS